MELSGTIHSIKEWEQLFIQSFPFALIHDGHFTPDEFDATKSASKVPAQSEVYTRRYKLFPFGKKQLWEERARVTFCYDERRGTGTFKFSSRAMHILGMEIKGMQVGIKTGKVEIPSKNTVHIRH